MEETKDRDLSEYCWKHAFLGMLNIYEWFEMIAAHQISHTKQMKEIAAQLPESCRKFAMDHPYLHTTVYCYRYVRKSNRYAKTGEIRAFLQNRKVLEKKFKADKTE